MSLHFNKMKSFLCVLTLLIAITSGFAQEINKIMIDPDLNREILIGPTDTKGMQNPIFVKDWESAVEAYIPEKDFVKSLKRFFKRHKEYSIIVFYSSWCGDSKKHMPHFVKLMQSAKIKNVEYTALNRKKALPEQDISDFNIERVPTFIVFKADKEVGRIIETPKVSLEADLFNIISKE
jgi:thiol-disulfide isomerase/thioredoxin